jgi:hypothetical protein
MTWDTPIASKWLEKKFEAFRLEVERKEEIRKLLRGGRVIYSRGANDVVWRPKLREPR